MENTQNENVVYLHKMLDSELEAIKQSDIKQRGFDQIEQKLKQLEVKLNQIKDDNQDNIRLVSQKKIEKIRKSSNKNMRSVSTYMKNKAQNLQNNQLSKSKKKFVYQSPPRKSSLKKQQSLAAFTNTHSYQTTNNKRTSKTNNNKTLKCSKSYYPKYQKQLYFQPKKSISRKSLMKIDLTYYTKSPRDRTCSKIVEQARYNSIQKQLKKCKKENKELKSKVGELKKYERDFLKLMEVFQKGQALRKNRFYQA